jgi:hypothetical protein
MTSMVPLGEFALRRQARSHRQSADGMCGHDNAQARQLREYPTFDQSDEGCPIHGAARRQRPDETVWRHLLGQRLRSDGMREYWHPELRRNFEGRARLRRVDQQVTTRTVDEEPAQSKLGDGPLGFTSGPVSVISVNRSEVINAPGMSHHQLRKLVVHRHSRQHFPARMLCCRLRTRCRQLETGWNMMIVEVNDFSLGGHELLAFL